VANPNPTEYRLIEPRYVVQLIGPEGEPDFIVPPDATRSTPLVGVRSSIDNRAIFPVMTQAEFIARFETIPAWAAKGNTIVRIQSSDGTWWEQRVNNAGATEWVEVT
jgi:hypothetical protein